LLLLALGLLTSAAAAQSGPFFPAPALPEPANVLILANSAQEQSVSLARYYAQKRGIPEDNIVALPMPDAETIDWTQYADAICNPLHDWLLARKWINEGERGTDAQGRTHGLMLGHRIGYLVICQGVPLRIAEDPALATPEAARDFFRLININPDTDPAKVSKLLCHSFASVDSELAAMPSRLNPVFGFVPNPLYRRLQPGPMELSMIIKTARLGGADYKAARGLVDSALEGEKRGLEGRVYIDKGGPFPLANQWLDNAAKAFGEAGWDVVVDDDKLTFQAGTRFDAPAFYFGWYIQYVSGPFAEPGMRFPPGAIAMHLHSFSASSLADRRQWASALVDRGAAGTIGNVYEPTLTLTHDMNIIAQALLAGWSFGDAAWCAMPALSWQGVVIGDPLYRPLGPREENTRGPRVGTYDQYRDVQAIMKLEKEGKADEALLLALSCYSRRPGCAIALKLAQMQHAGGNEPGAEMTLGFMAILKHMDCDQRGIALEAARLLAEMKADKTALKILENLRGMETSTGFAEKVRALGFELISRSDDHSDLPKWSK
jgi:uncharacterized protein (TIGR03790 family)